ncbi:MAG: hypothetical protein ACMUHX_04210 [bacterium]
MKAKHNANRFSLSIFLSIIFLLGVQCAVPPSPVFQKDGKFYGKTEGQWGGQWWNYYQRGLSYAQGAYWDYATRDLKEAIEKRSADQRRARTYGLHILDDYFPHRELGIIYYQQNRFRDAIAELEISLSQFESAKAKYFLNQARRGLLEETGQDLKPPKVYIAFPKSGYLTRFSSLTVSGEAMDDNYVGSVFVNKQEVPFELSKSSIIFNKDIKLGRGENRIMVEAIDLVGRSTREEVVAWCDQEAPMIYIDKVIKELSGQGYSIEGYISDLSGIAGFWLNGLSVNLPGIKGGEFSVNLHLPDLIQPLIFQAVDGLGNSTSGEMQISEVLGMKNDINFPRLAFSGQNPEGILAPAITRLAYSKEHNRSGPIIRLKDLPDNLTVDWEECFLEGEVRDSEGVSSIKINGNPLITRTAKLVFFNFLVPLEEGENLITIEAEGISGELETKTLSIVRKLNGARKIGARLSLAILPFKYRGEKSEIKDLVYDSLIQYLTEQARFQLVDREKIDGLLKRKKEGEDDNTSWIELGRLVTAEGVIVGSAYYFDGYLEIIARAVDTETTVVLDSEEVFGPVQSLRDVNRLTEGLSFKFKQAFPLLEGHIVDISKDAIRIDLGEKDHLLPYMKVIFFREGEPVKLTGSERILERKINILGEGRIKKIYKSSSEATLTSDKGDNQIEVDDRVITK